MYGQANYGPQFRQGPQIPRPSAQQQHPPAPPNLQFPQGPQAPLPPLVQQASPTIPPQMSQSGPHLYQHGRPARSPLVHPGPPPVQVPPIGTSNIGESYRHPLQSVHGSTPVVSQTYSSGQQAQHSSHMGAQNVHYNPTIAPLSHGPSCPEMLGGPQTLGALPPLPQAQGQTSYRASFFSPPPYPGGVQGLKHIPPLPPPPATSSRFFTPTAYLGSVQTIMGDSQVSSGALPPPPPSSPPPIPPSPPLSASPPCSISISSSLGSGDKVIATNQVRDDSSKNWEGGNGLELGSLLENVSSFDGSEMLNLPPPPSKPKGTKTVQRIEDLCQLIAKTGPGVEDVTRKNECGNPEYDFLRGGEPGSEAAIGHEYFVWLKNKCLMAYKVHEGKSESSLTPLQVDSLRQPKSVISAGCTSTADSDMEMEDDITFSDKVQEMNQSTDVLLHVKELDVIEQQNAPQISPECSLAQDISSEKLSCGSLNLHAKGESLTSKSAMEVHSQVTHSVVAAKCPSDTNLEKTVSPLADNLGPSSASLAAEAISSKKRSELIKGGSPFRLLQDYASDDSSGNNDALLHEDINPLVVPSSLRAGALSAGKDTGSFLERDTGSKSQHRIERSGQLSQSSLSHKAAFCSPASQREVNDAGMTSFRSGRADGRLDDNPGNQSFVTDATSHPDFQRKDTLDGAGGYAISERGKTLKETEEKKEKSESASLKVDEFGRLVREGSSDTDSDSGYTNRHERRVKRGRSRSHSRSPPDRRRKRRSSWRRQEKRSRSRSWSPRNRRSRSRSPTYRRSGDFSGEKLRSDRGRIPECFDFLRGRCNRGASCRYMHPEVDKSDRSRRYRSKQKSVEVSSGIKSYKTNKETKFHKEHVQDEARIQEMRGDTKVDWRREDIILDSQQSATLDHCGHLIDSGMVKFQAPGEAAGTVREEQIIEGNSAEPNLLITCDKAFLQGSHQPQSVDSFPHQCVNGGGADILKSCGYTSKDVLPLVKNSVTHQPQISVTEVQNTDCPPHQRDDFSVSDPSPNQTSSTSAKFSNSESFPNIIPTQSLLNASSVQAHSSEPVALPFPAPKALSPPSYSGSTVAQQSLQLPPPPPLPPTQSASAPLMPQLPVDYSSIPQVTSYALQPAHAKNPHNYQASSQFSAPPSSSWTSLPPPPPRPSYDLRFNAETATPGASSQYQHSHFPPYSSQISARPYPTELSYNSQVSEILHHAYPSMQEPHQPNLQLENSGPGIPRSQFGGSSVLREDRFSHPPVQDLNTTNSLGHGSLHQKPLPPSQELSLNRLVPFSGDLPSGELLKSSSQIHPFLHQQQASFHLQYPPGDSSVGMPGNTGSISQYPPDPLDRNRSSSDLDLPSSRISAHYNPYASTFDQPLSSKFSSTAFSKDKGFSLSHVAVDVQGVGSFVSRQTTSSPSSARAVAQILPKADGDQYDPLFDSIEPSSNAKRKDHDGQKWEPATDSDRMEKRSGLQKPLDLEENNRHKEVAAVASATSMDNDEFGETADAEVGAVEDESPSNPAGVATTGERESQKKSPGKKKKKKDSRSSKHFKIAIADFVKDVLKPSWRQGNMSKEAFKTIVKKTVDKVSGAMKGHQLPKSQAKINQYIDSSQRKLTKLVMGYVDKYVKS